MAFTKDQEAALIAINKRNKEQVEQSVPVEEQTAEPESTDPQSRVEPEVEVKEQPENETPKPEETPEILEVSSWDADETPTTEKVETPKFDFKKIGSALELEEIKSEDEIVAKVSELKTKLKEIQEQPLSGIPDEFKEVIEVAKSGADWKDYLSNQLIDYTKVDPIQLFEDDFLQRASKNPRYFTDGKFDEEKALAVLETIQEPVREFEGHKLAEALSANQRKRQFELKAKAEATRAKAEQNLSQATKNLNDLLPVETFGVKFEPKHSSNVYEGITSSKLTRKHLGVDYDTLVRSGADMKAIAKTIAAAEYAEKAIKFKYESGKVEAKKELLSKIQNPQIRSTGSAVQPESETKRELSPAEKLKQFVESTKKGL